MKSSSVLRLVPAALIVLWAGNASASGFQLLEQNASGIGNAFAGSAAVAENASTVYFNPAGMTELQGRNVSVGFDVIQPSYKFTNNGSVSAWATNGGDAGSTGFVPNGYFTMPVTNDLYVGLGIGAPFGLKTEYDDPWIGAAQSISFEVKTVNVNPSIAYRVNQALSVGFGLDWQRLDAKYKRRVGIVPNYLGALNLTAVTSNLDVSDDAWGWNAGVLFKLSPTTKVGISYRSQIKYKATGDVTLGSDGSAAGIGTMTYLNNNLGASSNVSADIDLPDTFIISATHQLGDRWELLGDLSWTGWSSIPKLDVVRTSGIAAGSTAQTLVTDFRDTWRIALGAKYKLRDDLKLKFGTAYDQTPVKGAETRLVSLPDNNRIWLSLGAQWMPTSTSALDVGGAYLFIKDPDINNNQGVQGLVKGSYSASVWIVGAQYSVQF